MNRGKKLSEALLPEGTSKKVWINGTDEGGKAKRFANVTEPDWVWNVSS